MKILIVEDEDSLHEVMIRSLEKERYVVESAANYQDALLKINDYDYDCIVLDIMLPGGSGLHLLEELKKVSCWYRTLYSNPASALFIRSLNG